ncbi:hypothetical protein DFH29DRAFT_915924, partial [Suillus ampliporus]
LIGRLSFPVSVSFDGELLNSLVSVGVGLSFGCPAVGSTFTAVLTSTYEGRPLSTDVLFEVVVVLHDDVVVGSDWLAAWRQVGHFDRQVAWHSSQLSEVEFSPQLESSAAFEVSPHSGGVLNHSSHDGIVHEFRSYSPSLFSGNAGTIESSSEVGAVLASRAHSKSILRDVLLGSRLSGVRASIFAPDYFSLHYQCHLHGLECALPSLIHILAGECATGEHQPCHADDIACQHIHSGFPNPSNYGDSGQDAIYQAQLSLLEFAQRNSTRKPLIRLLHVHSIEFDLDDKERGRIEGNKSLW